MANKLATVRAYNQDFARTYKYAWSMTDTNVKSLDAYALVTAATANILSASLLAVTIPSTGVQLIETNVGLYSLKLNGKKETGGTISPEFLLTGDYAIYKFFRSWANLAAPDMAPENTSDTQAKIYNITEDITITAYNVEGTSQLKVTLYDCWCRNAPELTFSDDTNDIIRWSPEIVYEYSNVVTG